ncbi:hypothetical protein MRX96_010474 [Rhipicephalus microplus]
MRRYRVPRSAPRVPELLYPTYHFHETRNLIFADTNTTSTRKCSRPNESCSDDERASRKMHAVATELATAMSLTTPSNDAAAHEGSVTHETDGTNESEFQTILFKSKKRRRRASTSQGPAAHTGPRPSAAPTAMPAHVAPGLLMPSQRLGPLLLVKSNGKLKLQLELAIAKR